MKRLLLGLALGVLGYLVGAVLTYFLVVTLSSNTHDRSVEAAMTAAFVGGPVLSLLAFLVGFLRRPTT